MFCADGTAKADIAMRNALEHTSGADPERQDYHKIAIELYVVAYVLAVQAYHCAKISDDLDSIEKYKEIIILSKLYHVMHINKVRPNIRATL